MRYLDFLNGVHKVLRPSTYLEVGIRKGDSLALSRARSIGIDPAFTIKEEIACDVSLFKTTSDEYFQRDDRLASFAGRPVDMAFIDGMHLFEYALRDFINVEAHSDWTSVIVFDDMLPRNVDEAARDRHTKAWTGDVYKIIPTLAHYRPDLMCIQVNTKPTGLLLVLGADPANRELTNHYDEIVGQYVTPDPQRVPKELMTRTAALDPDLVLGAPFWKLLTEARERGGERSSGLAALRQSLDETLLSTVKQPGALRRLFSRR